MKRILLCALVAIALQPVFAIPLEELIGSEQALVLRANTEPITEVQIKKPSPRLLPKHEGLKRFVAEIQNSLDPNVFVETLSLYRKPSASQTGTADWSKAEQTSLVNQLVALSTLAGIEYYSASRKSMRIFYESSGLVDGPTGKNQLSDPVYSVLPNSLVLYARQKDLTFGDNIYRYDYHISADAIFFVQENLTSMNAGIIPAVGKNKFRSVVAIIDAGDTLLVYAAAMAKTASVPGMGDRIAASFGNRAKAIFHWFSGRADKVFRN
jgi:hypothetical protein